MNVQPVGSGPLSAVIQAASKENAQPQRETVAVPEAVVSDTVKIGNENGLPPVYARQNPSSVRMRDESDLQAQILRRMVEKMITEQYEAGNHLFQLLYGAAAINIDPTLRMPAPALAELESARAQAEAMVGEEGFYGVSHTSARIVDYSKSISCGDASQIENLRAAGRQAFSSVGRLLGGGELPPITKQTYAAVMEGFDRWKAQSDAAAKPGA